MTNEVEQAWQPEIKLEQRLLFDPKLTEKGERNNLSGAACTPSGTCLLIGDEMRYAHFFKISGGTLIPQPQLLYLLPDPVSGKSETDGEGVIYADGYFYVIGSHSRNKQGINEPLRNFLYRIKVDTQAGLPTDFGTATQPSTAITLTTLRTAIDSDPLLKQHIGEAPGQGAHGVNIEGLAIAGDEVFVGFRGPVDGKGATVLKLSRDALFKCSVSLQDPLPGCDAQAESFHLQLGSEQGVRDMAGVNGGVLVLAGPEMREVAGKSGAGMIEVPPKPELFFWDKSRDAGGLIRLGALPAGLDSPEAITVLEETADAYRLLVLSDGKKAGGGDPVIIRVRKPGH